VVHRLVSDRRALMRRKESGRDAAASQYSGADILRRVGMLGPSRIKSRPFSYLTRNVVARNRGLG
jgi:hypothetical protein